MHTPNSIQPPLPFAALAVLISLISAPAFAQEGGSETGDNDPMSSLGLSLRAGIEVRTSRNFGSVTGRVLKGAELEKRLNEGVGFDTGIDPDSAFTTNEPFSLPESSYLTLAAALNFGSTFYYRVEPNIVLGELTSLNVYNGLGINLHFGIVYLGVGIGGQLGYMVHENFNGGLIASGRVPVDLHVYLGEDFALLAEAGFSTGIEVVQPHGVNDVSTASSTAMDFSLGIRFP